MKPVDILVKLFEHNNWANRQVIRACAALGEDQLDARPQSEKHWSIRENLVHIVECQHGYLGFFKPSPARNFRDVSFEELEELARSSGEGFITVIQAEAEGGEKFVTPVESSDGYRIDPWVVMLQTINHATEHRKQIVHLMRLLDVEAPRLDGWTFGEETGTVVPLSK